MPGFLAEVLTWPSNYHINIAVQTALDLNLAPSVMLIDSRQPSDPWTTHDKKLAIAWTILQRETCGKCGQPLWVCRNSSKDVSFSVRKATCYASAELEKKSDKEGKNLRPGQYFYSQVKTYSGKPLPDGMRKQYMEELAEE